MAGGVPAGRLSIELVAEVARLQQDLDKAKRMVSAASDEIARNANAANDNMARGFNRAGQQIVASAGQQRAGMQQLSYQIGDVAQQFALGTNPMIIFAQQGGQVVQALSLMRGGATGLLGFLSGPWGAVIMGAATVAGMFASKLWENKDAADGAADGYKNAAAEARNLIGAQNALKLNQKQMDVNKLTEEQFRLQSIVRKSPYARDPNAKIWEDNYMAGGAKRRLTAIAQEKMELESLIRLAQEENAAIEAKARATEKATKSSHAGRDATSAHARAMNEAAKEAEALAKALDDLSVSVDNGAYITMREMQKTLASDANDALQELQNTLAQNQKGRVDPYIKQVEERVAANQKLKQSFADIKSMADGLFGGAGTAASGFIATVKLAAPDLARSLKTVFDGFTDEQQAVLRKHVEDLSKVLAYAAIGKQVGGGTGGAIGGAIGGALGEKFLTGALTKLGGQAFGKVLGSLAGPLGAIAGGLLGGLIGGLLTGTKRGSATISNVGGKAAVSVLSGNNSQLMGVANTMATGLLKGIGNIAEQLGGQLAGAVSLSIGMRNKDYVVDPTGRGRTKGPGVMNFGEDQAAAVAYATQLAIQQGIITGLSAGADALLKAGGDLQAQLDKALKFDKVFKDLREQTDPLGYALDNLGKEMEKLRAIFEEAGASAADYAALEELYAIKKRKAVFEADRPRRELEIALMEAMGDKAGALAAQRALELEAMDASLRGLQRQVWAAQDLAAARAAEAEAAAAYASTFANAFAAAQEEAARRVEEAEDELRRAYEREAATFRDTIEQFSNLSKSLREFAWTLLPLNGNGGASLKQLNDRFRQTVALARLGNVEAMGNVVKFGSELRDAIIDTSTDRITMLRRLAEVRNQTEGVADVADRQVEVAQQQLDLIAKQVEQFVTLNDSVLSVRDAILALQDAKVRSQSFGEMLPSFFPSETSTATSTATDRTFTSTQSLFDDYMATNRGNSTVAWYLQDGIATEEELANLRDMLRISSPDGQAVILASINEFDPSGNTLAAIGAYANGGMHSGGLRLVGENGPELEATGPSRIYNANQLRDALAGTGDAAVEVKALREELKQAMFQIAKNTGKSYDLMNRWDGNGLPEIRDVAA